MDPTSWSAYSQHFTRLGASINHPPGALTQQAQMNDIALSSSLPRQEHIPGYGNAGGPHHFLLAASHGLNPSQANHNDPSFNANLFAANYDASLFSTSFPSANKGHLPSFPQGAAGLFKAVNRENDFNDLRTGFSHCGMSAYGRNSDGNNGLPGTPGLSSGHLFPNSMPPGSWRHSGIIPSQCGPFGVLPHETVLQRSHLVGRGGEKLSVQASKQSRTSLPASSFVEQDLSRGYRSILSSPARPPSSYVDSSNTSHSSLLSSQNDPYFSSVSDNYYSSCSKNDFAAYSSYCSNVQPGVQRSSISPYCYSQSFGNFETNPDKPDVPTTSTNSSANSNFSNFVPNNSLNGNPTHLHNGQISRQSVITSNINNNSAVYNSESHPSNHSYNVRESYPYPPGAAHATSCLPTHPTNSRGETNNGRQSLAHMNNSHHSSSGQNLYPPMSTPIPASTPAHTTPPSSSMGQAYVPTPLPLSHDSGCSSVNSQSVMYHSPSNDGCYSTPGTCPSESGSPAKQDLSQHSSPSVYSIESSNLSVNSGPFVENQHGRPHSSSEINYSVMNGGLSSDVHENTNDSSKVVDENLHEVGSALMVSDCRSQQKDIHLPQVLPIDMVKLNKENVYQNTVEAHFEGRPASVAVQGSHHAKHLDPMISSRSECAMNNKSDNFSFPSESSPPALDFTAKGQKCKQGRKRKHESNAPLNCTYSHLENNQSQLTSPASTADTEEVKTPLSNTSINNQCSPVVSSDPPVVANTSPLPVDLSNSMNLCIKKPDSPPEKNVKEILPDLNYETNKSTGGKWSLVKQEVSNSDEKMPIVKNPEDLSVESNIVKEQTKCVSPLCRTPPMDDLSDESKKLCNSIEEDLGFLAGLSSDPDVEDSVSKGSFSDKKGKKDKGFLQSFLTFLESSNEPTVSNSSEGKTEKKESPQGSPEKEEKKGDLSVEDHKEDDDKNLLEESNDKDNFDEAPSLDPTLFGCSTLQKEMVVPNPEAPSFSSDEDENSTQGIFDSVAMAIKRLCEDNEEDHSEKGNKSGVSSRSNNTKKEMPVLTSMSDAAGVAEEVQEDLDIEKEATVEECTIKRACVVKGRRGKRRRTRHLLVIKVKRTAEKSPVALKNPKTTPLKPKRTRTATKDVQILKTVPNTQRRPLMRKCKEKGLRKKNSRTTKRKTRNNVKKKYLFEETTNAVIEIKDDESVKDGEAKMEEPLEISAPLPDVITSTLSSAAASASKPSLTSSQSNTVLPQTSVISPQPVVLLSKSPTISTTVPTLPVLPPEMPPVTRPAPPKKKKVNKTIGYRTRKRRRKPRKPPEPVIAVPQTVVIAKPELPKVTEETSISVSSSESIEAPSKQSISNNESCWNTEIHFKTGDYLISIDNQDSEYPPIWRIEGKNVLQLFETGDYLISIDNQDSEYPPIWRIEGKNVLQLFEVFESEGSSSILYRNTSSYSRWSPSSKHKYLKQPVKIIKSDDDTVIVEILKSSENIAETDFSGSCDYTIHPQRENFEVYLQTLVSHALDPDFIPEIIKEKDEYFLSHLQAIEEITLQKKNILHDIERWSTQLFNSVKMFPLFSVSKCEDDEKSLCEVCQNSNIQFVTHFQGHVYDPMTLENKEEVHSLNDFNFPLCGSCVQTVTLYSRLHHHKYHFFQLGCKKVKDVTKGEDKDSHTILEDCLQDIEWVTEMFQDMLEMWNACDKYR
ncbi:DUF4211 domain-containing protein [Nephila pilipes]|uniref:DUF4211 domain-containing protein n=1 Tax=Nephila pilipes TaxID=299642 RepID=A0A8X6QDG5_NEPPI|nr:DUF4211 domain-containing protein [Nephila pilipes]